MPNKRQSEGRGTAKLFMHGRSQAVRLPKEFRFEGTEVRVSRDGSRVILEPMVRTPGSLSAVFQEIDRLLDGDAFLSTSAETPPDPPVTTDPRAFYE